MSYALNQKLSGLKPYDPIEGNYNIRLDANESFLNINPILQASIQAAISDISLNRYPDPYATQAVKAFADLYQIPEQYVTAGNGSDELISVITSCFLETGDRLLTLSPDFSMYAFYGALFELEVHTLEKNPDLTIDIQKLIDVCNTENIKALIFSNPCNPTSLGLSREDVQQLLSSVSCLVILDEAYMDFWDQSLLKSIALFDNLIILKTCSKAIGLAAVRLGFAVAGNTITRALKAAKSPYNTDSIAQALGKCVLSEKDLIRQNIQQIIALRDTLYASLSELSSQYSVIEKVYSPKTNFVFLKTSKAEAIYTSLLSHSIAIRKLGDFLRITTGSADENAEFLACFERILKAL